MNEFIKKLIERLEEELSPDKECFEYEDDYQYAEERHNKMLNIVNQLASEYKHGHFGCNSNGEHEKCDGCGMAGRCNIRNTIWFGMSDNDVCEWNYSTLDEDLIRPYHHKDSVGMYKQCLKSHPFCPYCGKKIKVVE